ncbi:hypothetical protein [Streptomyces sp. NPDC005423]|uniref:hypothetical protein n=1 Tax=Streptomyces sp. NPDC005423 TaxID=3155343 RepID=UPI0033B1D658
MDLRTAYTADTTGRADEIVAALPEVSPEPAELCRSHEVDVTHHQDPRATGC